MPNGNLKKCTGIIISPQNIIAIEVSNKKGIPFISNYSKVALEEDIVESNCIILDPDRFKEAIRELLKNGTQGVIKADQFYIVLPEESTFEHKLLIPKEYVNDIEYVKEVATDYIPIELDEAVFDFREIGSNKESKEVNLRFIAAQNSIIKPLISTLKEINLEIVGIKIDVDCLMRSFNNSLNKQEGAFMLLNMDPQRDLISIVEQSGEDHRIILRRNEKEFKEAIKSAFNLTSEGDCKEICLKIKNGEALEENEKRNLAINLKPYLENLEKSIRNLIQATNATNPIQVSKIYLTGMLTGLPGIHEMIQGLFPEIEIAEKIEYAKIPMEIEREALEGIGICVKEMQGEENSSFNLLPETKKEELSIAPLIPKFKRYFLVISLLLGILSIRMGITTAGTYINYRVKAQEAVIMQEHALNPYLMSVAKLKQERKRLHDQILSVLDNSLPVSIVMKTLDEFNKGSIEHLNITYVSDKITNESRIELRTEVDSRQKTETFVKILEANGLFEEVISPLSNLVGKAQRLVRIELSLNERKLLESFNQSQKKENPEPNTDNE